MNMQFSFSNKFQYENNLNGYTSTVSITEPQLQNIFHILDVLLCDPPNYHCRLRNDKDDEIYLCFTILNDISNKQMDYFKDLFRGETNVSPRFLSFIKYI